MSFNCRMDRRSALRAAFAAGLAAAGASGAPLLANAYESKWPAKPRVPTDLNLEELFVELEKGGKGLRISEVKDAPTVYMLFDTQCSWCVWEEAQFEPFFDKVNFVWFPVALLSPWSPLQGAAILAAKDPVAAWKLHRDHFKDPDFRGLDVRKMDIPFEMQKAVWDNSKIYRRAGGREVPFGVMKTTNGRYVSIPEMKREEFVSVTGIDL